MTRQQLEHLIRAVAVIADDDELIVIGRLSTMAIEDPIRAPITARIANDFRGMP